MKKKIRSIAELDEIAKIIVADWKPNNVYAFYGEMGTGKTTLIRSICRAAQVEDTVSSPTYGFVNEYYSPTCGKIFHFDLYRIDSIEEAERVFSRDLTATLLTIARDVKIQVEFNPGVVASYRLLGYENRDVADADFRNDAVDAGEIGAGHSVTALYEVSLVPGANVAEAALTVRVRFGNPQTDDVQEISQAINLETRLKQSK